MGDGEEKSGQPVGDITPPVEAPFVGRVAFRRRADMAVDRTFAFEVTPSKWVFGSSRAAATSNLRRGGWDLVGTWFDIDTGERIEGVTE